MRIDLPGLEAFVGIAHWGSFRRAAGHLNLSQAALSHRLRKLEENLGVSLLSRTTRQVMLTPAGLEVLPVAQRLLHEMSATLDGLRERSKNRRERIAIGCLPTVALVHVPPVLASFQAQRPGSAVQVYDVPAAEIARRVREGDVDFGVTIVSANSWDLEIRPLVKDPFVLACPVGHPLAAKPEVSWQDLDGEHLIRISAEAGNRALIDNALGHRGDTLSWRYEVQRVTTAVGLVEAGLGLAIVPAIGVVACRAPGIATVTLRNPSVTRALGIVTRRGEPLSTGAADLADLFRRHLGRDPKVRRPGRDRSKAS